MNSITNLSSKQLRRLANLKVKMESIQQKLGRILGTPTQTGDGATPRKRRRMSAVGRARIAAAARARWAKQRGTKAPKATPKPKRRVSIAVRKRLAQLAKQRWAKAKAAGKSRL